MEEELLQKHTTTEHGAWLALEESRSSRHWLPWHPDVAEGEADDDCEDPERLVLFDDIKDFVRPFSEPRQQLQILMTYLGLLGVEIDCDLPSNSQAYFKRVKTHLNSVGQVAKNSSYVGACESSPLSQSLQIKVINNVFEQSVGKFQGHERSELTYLWLIWKLQEFQMVTKDMGKKDRKGKAKELKQFAKKILGEDVNRSDLRVWEGYALLEWAIGNTEEGDKVMSGALSMTSFDLTAGHLTLDSCQASRLYRLYAEHMFGTLDKSDQKRNKLLLLLVIFAANDNFKMSKDSSPVSSVQLLKAKRNFQMGLDCLLSGETLIAEPAWEIGKRGCLLEHWSNCYAMFEYLTSGLKSADSVFDQVLSRLETSSDVVPDEPSLPKFMTNACIGYDPKMTFLANLKERLTIASVKLAQHQVSSTVSPLRTLRDPMMLALSKLPDSLPLLLVFLKTESSANILGQLRRRLLPIAKQANTPLPWITAVLGELQRQHCLDQQLLAELPQTGN